MTNFKQFAIALFVVAGVFSGTAQTKKVDVKSSSVKWMGEKVTGKHMGTVAIQEGALMIQSGKLVGGMFTVDMTSIAVTDLKAGQGKEKLEGHLKADDFFGTDKYPTAKLEFTTVIEKTPTLYAITANLTIKGKTSPVKFDLVFNANKATTKVIIDRTKYGIEYKSGSFFDGLGDATIYDNFELDVVLVF